METLTTTIDTGKALVNRDEKGTVFIRIKDGMELELEDIESINSAKDQLAGDELYTVIFSVGQYCAISPEARAFSASAAVYRNAIAKAIIAPDLPGKLISNFFIKFNRPPAPTRLFNTEQEALLWLEQIRKKTSSLN